PCGSEGGVGGGALINVAGAKDSAVQHAGAVVGKSPIVRDRYPASGRGDRELGGPAGSAVGRVKDIDVAARRCGGTKRKARNKHVVYIERIDRDKWFVTPILVGTGAISNHREPCS